MSARAAVVDLERLARHLLRGEPPGFESIGAGIMRWLEDRDAYAVSLHKQLGLAVAPGDPDPRRVLRAERREALCIAALHCMPGASASSRARELHRRLNVYETGRWRHDGVRFAPASAA